MADLRTTAAEDLGGAEYQRLPGPMFAGGPKTALALDSAATWHHGQKRKSLDVPYIIHPVRVMFVLLRYGITDDDMLAAALLHDVLEDVDRSLAWTIQKSFGDRVLEMVQALSERKYADPADSEGEKLSWKLRKALAVYKISHSEDNPTAGWLREKAAAELADSGISARVLGREMAPEAVVIKVADVIDNLTDTKLAMDSFDGEGDYWDFFKADEKSQLRYYSGILVAASNRVNYVDAGMFRTGSAGELDLRDMLGELRGLLVDVFGDAGDELVEVLS